MPEQEIIQHCKSSPKILKRLKVGGHYARPRIYKYTIHAGVPQGSLLGPFVNDLLVAVTETVAYAEYNTISQITIPSIRYQKLHYNDHLISSGTGTNCSKSQ